MTFEEAKKILKKEVFGIRFKKFDKPLKFEEKLWICNEKPEVIEALHILAKNGISVSVPETALRIRSIIIKKMRAGEGVPDSVSDTPLSAAEGIKLQWKDNKNTDKNPALAEAASQFNDVLLDEQTKKIEKLAKENERLKDQIAVLDACKKHNDKIDRKQIKHLGKEIAKLNGIIHDKNAILSDVAEELRLSKIREKNLTEVCQKYIKANGELKEKLKSINENRHKELTEKDEVIADLGKELAESKKQNIAVMVDMTAKCLRAARESINDVFESYAAKYAKSTLDELKDQAYDLFNAKANNLGLVGSKDGNGIFDKMVGVDVAEEGADHSDVIVLCKDKENEEAAEELSKVLNDVIDRFLLFGGIITKEE